MIGRAGAKVRRWEVVTPWTELAGNRYAFMVWDAGFATARRYRWTVWLLKEPSGRRVKTKLQSGNAASALDARQKVQYFIANHRGT